MTPRTPPTPRTRWNLVLTVGVLCFVVGGVGTSLGWFAQPTLAALAVVGLILVGAGASRRRRALGASGRFGR